MGRSVSGVGVLDKAMLILDALAGGDRLNLGEHTILVIYEGDANYGGNITSVVIDRTPKPR